MVQPTRPVRPVESASVTTWAIEADVVIVGLGIAGVSAAIAAASAGAKVVVLERSGGWGGAAALSGGFVYLGGGTALQTACGIDDDVEEMYRFLMSAMGPGADPEKIRPYCDGSAEHYDWLVANGVEFPEVVSDELTLGPHRGVGLMYSGGESAWPFKEIAVPAPRGHVPAIPADAPGERGGGYYLMEPLVACAEELGVRVEYDVRVDTLCTEDGQHVVGVTAVRHGEQMAIRARRGVVLAAGGFTYNDEMTGRFSPEVAGRYGAAMETHDGHAIRMAQAIGADLGRMDGASVTPSVQPAVTARGLLVNELGNRFVPEDSYSGRVGHAIRYRENDTAYLLIDEQGYDEAPGSPGDMSAGPIGKPLPTWASESLAELEESAALPPGSLEATVAMFNRHAVNGEDPFLHKGAKWIRPLEPPFALLDLSGPGRAFSLGGLRTDADGRVVHVSGEPIPGLYAAGRSASGVPVLGYASGTSLGDGTFFGRRAGTHAAEQNGARR